MNKYFCQKKVFFLLLLGISTIPVLSANSLREKLLNEFRSFFGGSATVPAEKDETKHEKTANKQSPEKEKVIANSRFAKVYTQLIRVFHPLMLRFDYQHRGFVGGELEHYALPGHYNNLIELLKGRELSLQNEKSYNRSIALSATDLKKLSEQEDELEKIQAEIAAAIEKIRLDRKLVMILHENINTNADPFDRQIRLITPGIPDLTMEVLATIYQNYGMNDQKSQELLKHIESCQNW